MNDIFNNQVKDPVTIVIFLVHQGTLLKEN